MRQKKKEKRLIPADPLYNNLTVGKFINYIMRRGKKELARKIVYQAFEIIKEKTKKNPLEIFEAAINNASPQLEVVAKRVGGATYQVPREVKRERKKFLAMNWIITAARKKRGRKMAEKLARELIEASENQGWAVKKKQDLHRLAEANRAFAHFAW